MLSVTRFVTEYISRCAYAPPLRKSSATLEKGTRGILTRMKEHGKVLE